MKKGFRSFGLWVEERLMFYHERNTVCFIISLLLALSNTSWWWYLKIRRVRCEKKITLSFGFWKSGKLNSRAFLHSLPNFFALFDDFSKWSVPKTLWKFEKSSNMAKLWQKMKKNLIQLAFNPILHHIMKIILHSQHSCLEKRFKICYILYIQKPKVACSIFHFVLLYCFP